MLSKALAVNEALDKAIPLTYPKKIHESMRYCLLAGGKWVRPVLCIATCELVGGKENFPMPVDCAITMVETICVINHKLSCLKKMLMILPT